LAAVPQLARGEAAEATRELYERYAEPIFRFCLVQLGSREEAEDALQSTFLNAFRGLKRGVRPTSESAWLYKIAHNICLTRRRSTLRRGRFETPKDIDLFAATVPAPAPAGVDELIALGEALESMPGSQRRAILLREWQGLSYREIGEQMGLSQGAVETLIFRARRSLADRLERPARPRIRHALDAGWLVAALKGLLGAGAATKAVATATVVATAVVLTVGPPTEAPKSAPEQTDAVPQRAVPVRARPLATAAVAESVRAAPRTVAARPRRAASPARAKRPVVAASRPKPVAAPPPAARAAPVVPAVAKARPSKPAAKPKPAHGERTRPAEPQKERRVKHGGPAPAAAKEKAKGPSEVRGRGRSDEAKEPGSNKPPAAAVPAAEPDPPAAAAADAAPASQPADHGNAGGNDKEKDKGPTG
jgi:RNA polymerase sigma factor (sigma-70 family)